MAAIPLRSIFYQWESLLYRQDLKRKKVYQQEFGYQVKSRDDKGQAKEVDFRVYSNSFDDIFLVGPFNEWGENDLDSFKFTCQDESGFHELRTTALKHKDPYLFLTRNELLRDPAATFFDKDGNCIFWDFDDPSTYKKRFAGPNTLRQSTALLQTDLPGLVSRWFEFDESAKTTAESDQDLFTYIATCGVLEKVKELGFNTIQFLPVAQSIDGDNWKFRYLVPYSFALQKNWGDPDSFARMIDKCHELGIAVICDLILSHCPHKDYRLFGMNGEDVGLHKWITKYHEETYLQEQTPWGTMRFRYGDGNVRRYLTESALHYLIRYGIDGFRIDNVDGILRYGDAGQGPDREFGRPFMRELIEQIYTHNPFALIHLESHYFYGDNAKMLVAPLATEPRALGATAYNSSRLTYYFHKEFMPKAVEETSVWRFEHIRDEKEWGRSNSTIADFHNHDAAAGLMHGRATGSYAYDALILKNPNLAFHAIGKIKVMEAIIAFGCEGRFLDLLQSFLLQEGTFEHDSSIQWGLLRTNEDTKKVIEYKKQVNLLTRHPAFFPENTIYRKYVNVDETNKVLVIRREDRTQGSKDVFYILVNLSSRELHQYSIGVQKRGSYSLVFDSDREQFRGTGQYAFPEQFSTQKSTNFALFSHEICFQRLAPYQVLIIKQEQN
ncbi:MAG: alpha amylase C-terminal domain-containing protein [Nanoarchaeota archaeon]|nr:alpha amylase C-terminal domain-containing protein [Nanoarchaeota archaeon]